MSVLPSSSSSPTPSQNYTSAGPCRRDKTKIFVFGMGCPREFRSHILQELKTDVNAIMRVIITEATRHAKKNYIEKGAQKYIL
jgi:hypothetical protein